MAPVPASTGRLAGRSVYYFFFIKYELLLKVLAYQTINFENIFYFHLAIAMPGIYLLAIKNLL